MGRCSGGLTACYGLVIVWLGLSAKPPGFDPGNTGVV